MLHLVPSQSPELAYAVPLCVDRSRAPTYRLINDGDEPLRGVTLTLLGSGLMLRRAPAHLHPGSSLKFTLRGDDSSRSSVVIVRWFRMSGEQYLWRISF